MAIMFMLIRVVLAITAVYLGFKILGMLGSAIASSYRSIKSWKADRKARKETEAMEKEVEAGFKKAETILKKGADAVKDSAKDLLQGAKNAVVS